MKYTCAVIAVAITYLFSGDIAAAEKFPSKVRNPRLAEAQLEFTVPDTWTQTGWEEEEGGMYGLSSSSISTGYIRTSDAIKETALEWAIDEAKAVEPQGAHIIVPPTELQVGDVTWVTLVWEGYTLVLPSGTKPLMKNQQYFSKAHGIMIEVSLGGPKEIFESANQEEITQFLSTVHIAKITWPRLRPCKQSDMIGSWKLIHLYHPPASIQQPTNPEEPHLSNHQRYVFYPNGTMRHLTATGTRVQEIDKELDAVVNAKTWPDTTLYSLDKESWLTTRKKSLEGLFEGPQIALCGYVVEDGIQEIDNEARQVHKGDLFFLYYIQEETPVFWKQLRKIQQDPAE